jgi:hypothetical protein
MKISSFFYDLSLAFDPPLFGAIFGFIIFFSSFFLADGLPLGGRSFLTTAT